VLLLVEDIAALKPTFFPSVPRLFNRIYSKIVDGQCIDIPVHPFLISRSGTVNAPGIRGLLFKRAVADKLANLESGAGVTHWFWDRLLFSKVSAILGGRVRLMMWVLAAA
jgi:long-chain acyl-CoA synthetase